MKQRMAQPLAKRVGWNHDITVGDTNARGIKYNYNNNNTR